MLPTDLYQIIYGFADDFTKLRLHQVCRYFYSIRVPDTELMQQIKSCMDIHGHISYADSIADNKYLLSISLDNYDIHRELIKLINLLDAGRYDGRDNEGMTAFILEVINTHGVNITEFCHKLYSGNYHEELFRFFNLTCGNVVGIAVIRYFANLPPNSMIQLLKSVNGKVHINWDEIIYYIYSHFDNYVEILSVMYNDYYDARKNNTSQFLTDFISFSVKNNTASFYDMLFENHSENFIKAAIVSNSISAMQYISRNGAIITKDIIQAARFYHTNKSGSYYIYKYLGDRMDNQALALFLQLSIDENPNFIKCVLASDLRRMDYYTFGFCMQKNIYGPGLEFIEFVYKNLINDANCLSVVRGIIDCYTPPSTFKPVILMYIYKNSTESVRSEILSYINSNTQDVKRDKLLRAMTL